jgi:hypothetical protein
MKFFSQDFFMAATSTQLFSARCTIVPVEDDNVTPMPGVTVVLTAPGATQEGNSIVVPLGTTVSWSASKDGYKSSSGTVTVNGDIDKKITLVPVAVTMWTYSISSIPATAAKQMNSSDGTSSNTGTIVVPEGSTVTWSVSNTGMNSATGTRLIPQDSSESSPIVDVVTLTANLSIAGVTPNDARVEWRPGVGNTVSGLSIPNVPVNTTVNLRIYKDGYNEQNVSFPRNGATYITTEQLSAVTLTPKNYTFSVSASPTGSTVKVQKNGGSWQSFTTTATLTDCHVGDVIKYYAEKTGYATSSQISYTMGASSYTAPAINLIANSYNVSITASPSGATVTLVYGGTTKTGTGSVTASVTYGTSISYYASYLGTTSATKTATVSNTYSDSITLTPPNTVEVITSNVSGRVLPKGNYVAILVGGGSAGIAGGYYQSQFSSSSSTANYAVGGEGGNGGGSGCVKKYYFSANGTDSYNFVIGTGGQKQKYYCVRRSASGATGITVGWIRTVDPVDSDTSLNGTDSYITKGSTEIARAVGGSLVSVSYAGASSNYYDRYGGTGGNGGGIGGGGQRQVAGSSATAGADGQAGAKSGNNSKRTITIYNGQTSILTHTYEYKGQLDVEGAYDTNTATFNANLANPGKAGKGLVSYTSSLNTAAKLNSVSEATLLANMSGGGAGSSGGASATSSSSASKSGASGGGGGGWFAGEDATVDSAVTIPTSAHPWYSGKGGNGVILLACLAWT